MVWNRKQDKVWMHPWSSTSSLPRGRLEQPQLPAEMSPWPSPLNKPSPPSTCPPHLVVPVVDEDVVGLDVGVQHPVLLAVPQCNHELTGEQLYRFDVNTLVATVLLGQVTQVHLLLGEGGGGGQCAVKLGRVWQTTPDSPTVQPDDSQPCHKSP